MKVTADFSWDENAGMIIRWSDETQVYKVPKMVFDDLDASDDKVQYFIDNILDWYPVSYLEE